MSNKNQKGERGNFFTISQSTWVEVCELGMNQACLYLVMGRGTGRDNRTTVWSANALEKYTNITRSRAKAARESLKSNGLVGHTKAGNHPRYKLPVPKGDDAIWLPNEIVTGLDGVSSPMERVRQTSDVMCLRLFIELYGFNRPTEDAGISRRCVHGVFEKHKIADSGEFAVLGFNRTEWACYLNHAMVKPHLTKGKSKATASGVFFERLQKLADIGLINFVPFLCESDDPESEIIHPLICPYTGDTTPSLLASEAAQAMLSESFEHIFDEYELIIPILRHRNAAHVFGIGFLKYRPKTATTAAGYAITLSQAEGWEKFYSSLTSDGEDVQYQVGIK